MECPKCTSQLPDDAKFCSECGVIVISTVQVDIPTPSTLNDEDIIIEEPIDSATSRSIETIRTTNQIQHVKQPASTTGTTIVNGSAKPDSIPQPFRATWLCIPGFIFYACAIYVFMHTTTLWVHWFVPSIIGLAAIILIFIALHYTILPLLLLCGTGIVTMILNRDPATQWGLGISFIILGILAWKGGENLKDAEVLSPEDRFALDNLTKQLCEDEVNNFIELSFNEFAQQYLSLCKDAESKTSVEATKQNRLIFAHAIFKYEPGTIDSIIPRIRKSIDDYNSWYNRTCQVLVKYCANTDHHNLLIPTALLVRVSHQLIEVLDQYQKYFDEIHDQRNSLLSRHDRIKKILMRDGFIEGSLEVIESLWGGRLTQSRTEDDAFLSEFGDDIGRYFDKWDEIADVIYSYIIPQHKHIYNELIQFSLNNFSELYNVLSAENFPLRPYLKGLQKGLKA